jgi:hypothetical protein
MAPKPYQFIGSRTMDGPKNPMEFKWFGAMYGPKNHITKFIGFGTMGGPKTI